MLSKEENDLLTQVGPGTPCGKLLRSYWQPAALSEERDALEDIYEPFLIQIGFLDRTARGRVATARAYEYFGLTAPQKDRLW